MSGRAFLHTPGPTNIPDRVLEALRRSATDFLSEDFIGLADRCQIGLQAVFGTVSPVVIYTASGHGAWEAAFANLTAPGDHILLPATGLFSMAWEEMATDLGLVVESIPSDERRAIDADRVVDHLRADTAHQIKMVALVHTETATGVTSDVQSIRRAIAELGHPAMVAVDAIASLGTAPLLMDRWDLDVVIGASQTGLMCPPGLSFTAIGPRALVQARTQPRASSYWSWARRLEGEFYRRFGGTPPVHLLFALHEALAMIADEGLDRVLSRHARLAGSVRAAVDAWAADGNGMEFNALIPAERAEALTCVRTPPGVDAEELRVVARDHFNVILGGGLGEKLAGRAFRIGHLGDLNEPMVLGALGGVELALAHCGVPHGPGGVSAAIDYLQADSA